MVRGYTTYGEMVARILKIFKYERTPSLSIRLSRLLFLVIEKNKILREVNYIVPIPENRIRENFRGFNQSYLLACHLSKMIEIPLEKFLLKKKHIPPQASLPLKKRIRNIKGVFSLSGDVRGKRLLLVDDVFTTGSTMNEAARVLKMGGAEFVGGIVFAISSHPVKSKRV